MGIGREKKLVSTVRFSSPEFIVSTSFGFIYGFQGFLRVNAVLDASFSRQVPVESRVCGS